MRAYFELLFRFLLFCPAGLLSSADLDTALRLAVACVGASDLERESARAVLVFLGQLAGRCGGQLDRYRGEVEAALAPHGEALTRLMFAALAVRSAKRSSRVGGGGRARNETNAAVGLLLSFFWGVCVCAPGYETCVEKRGGGRNNERGLKKRFL